MSNEPKTKSIREHVLSAIKSGQVTMRPKWHFVLRATLLVVGIILAALTLLYIVSFILFVLRLSGLWFIPTFGWRGLWIFIISIPWILIIIGAIFIIILELLVRRYSFAYRRPLFYSVLGIIGLAIIGGSAVAQTTFHRRLWQDAEARQLRFAGPFYHKFGYQKSRHIHPGVISELTAEGFRLKDPRNEMLTIIIVPDTRFPRGTGFMIDDKVVVLGKKNGDIVTAEGIIKIDSGYRFPREHRRRIIPRPID